MFLKVIHRRRRTGFEETKDFPIRINDLIAGRYQVLLGDHALTHVVLYDMRFMSRLVTQ